MKLPNFGMYSGAHKRSDAYSNLQWLSKKLAVSISVIRKLAVVFIPVEIQKFY